MAHFTEQILKTVSLKIQYCLIMYCIVIYVSNYRSTPLPVLKLQTNPGVRNLQLEIQINGLKIFQFWTGWILKSLSCNATLFFQLWNMLNFISGKCKTTNYFFHHILRTPQMRFSVSWDKHILDISPCAVQPVEKIPSNNSDKWY